jgi:hypothetical protein
VQALSPEVAEFACSGVAIIVATRDGDLRPEIGRGWAPVVDGSNVTLCITARDGSPTRTNLESNGRIAVTCSRPTTYRTIQLKGSVVEIRDVRPDDEQRVAGHLEAFIAEAQKLGLPQGFGQTFVAGELIAVTFAVEELYDQTPGPGAGAPL